MTTLEPSLAAFMDRPAEHWPELSRNDCCTIMIALRTTIQHAWSMTQECERLNFYTPHWQDKINETFALYQKLGGLASLKEICI